MNRSGWRRDTVDINFVTVGSEEYDQLLDEWAEVVYRYLCQLHEKKSLVPETSMPLAAESTGTDE